MSEFEKAIGQFIIYRIAMRKKEPNRELFLAVEKEVYNEFFLNPDVIELVESEDLRILIFDKKTEAIVKWIN